MSNLTGLTYLFWIVRSGDHDADRLALEAFTAESSNDTHAEHEAGFGDIYVP